MYVPLRPICEYLGLDWSAQFRRLKRDEVLADELTSVAMTTTLVGRRYVSVCLPLEYLPGWLFGIDATRVKPELKEKILRYRRECYRVLWQAFQGQVFTVVEQESSPAVAALNQIREMGLAIVRMAEQQIETDGIASTVKITG